MPVQNVSDFWFLVPSLGLDLFSCLRWRLFVTGALQLTVFSLSDSAGSLHLGDDLPVEIRSCLVELFPRSELFRELGPHTDMNICEKPVIPTHRHAHGIPVQVTATEDLENGVYALFTILHNRLVTQSFLDQVLCFSHLLLIDCLYLQAFADLLAVVTPSDVRVRGSESQKVSLLAGFLL